PSKEAFAEAVVAKYSGDAVKLRMDTLSNGAVAPLDRLRASFEAFLPYYASKGFMEGCLLGNLGVDAADRSDLVRGSLQSAFKAWQTDLHALLAEADLAGDLPRGLDPAMTAAFLVNSWEGALVRMKVERSDEPLRCFFTIFDHLIMGQRPKSPIKTGRSKSGRRKTEVPRAAAD